MNRVKSEEIFSKSCTVMPGGVSSPARAFGHVGCNPLVVERGEGAYLYDVDGNRYVDYVLSWGPLVLGHGHPAVLDALSFQGERGVSFGALCEAEVELAEYITGLFPSIDMVRFVNSGTEAAMSALRLARAFTRKEKVIKFSGCYHGHVDSLLVKAGSGVLSLGLPDSPGVPSSVAADTLLAQYNNIGSVEEIFAANRGQIAAVIVEPIVGNSGFIKPQGEFLEELRQITEREGALLIFDEVMTGFRVHPVGAQLLYGITPDLTMLGKVIGGGLNVAAYGGREDIMKLVAPSGPVYQAGTLSGNPLGMRVGLATLREWHKTGVFETAANYASRLAEAISDIARSNGVALVADNEGTMFGYFFSEKPIVTCEDAAESDLERFRKFFAGMFERGVYFAQSQFEAGFVSASHNDETFQKTVSALEEVFPLL
ncbi:MAG: glutamate-1-semialdehyde-2,1-aminomutase [Candidatus Dadabacteria bacterium]|nr:MAG: glutamate-1-semialdehyde-2,1-aminomutase [Candidatus Dadabacteria bacterium]